MICPLDLEQALAGLGSALAGLQRALRTCLPFFENHDTGVEMHRQGRPGEFRRRKRLGHHLGIQLIDKILATLDKSPFTSKPAEFIRVGSLKILDQIDTGLSSI